MAQPTFSERTRATAQQQRFKIPPSFASILKEYTREVLREQPSDILAWSATYFKRMALETDPMLARQPPPEHYEPSVDPEMEVMAMRLSKLFAGKDEDMKGRLYSHILRNAMIEELGLTVTQVQYILSSDYVDVDDNGLIEYPQLSRSAVNAVLYFQQSHEDFAIPDDDDEAAVHGLSKDEVMTELSRSLRAADADGLGRLQFNEYRSTLMHVPLHLSRRDINLLCIETEISSEGYVDIKREVRQAFALLLRSQEFTAFDEQAP